jgi:hypothetical protein
MSSWPAVATVASPPGLPVGRILTPVEERDADNVCRPIDGAAGTANSTTLGTAGKTDVVGGWTTFFGEIITVSGTTTRVLFFFVLFVDLFVVLD